MLGTLFLFLVIILLIGVVLFFTPSQPTKNKKEIEETNNWEYQKEQARKESEAEQNKEWFSEGRWLTDKEIDWAISRMIDKPMPGSWPGQSVSKFKILLAHQFYYVAEVRRKKEVGWELGFRELLNQINDPSKELIFIPINQPNYHWSLLVYETKSKKFFHYDTLRGANWRYVKDGVYELLDSLQVPKHLWGQHFLARHKIRQKNGWECGVVAIARKIREKYQGEIKKIELGEFDFGKEREELREKYLKEQREN